MKPSTKILLAISAILAFFYFIKDSLFNRGEGDQDVNSSNLNPSLLGNKKPVVSSVPSDFYTWVLIGSKGQTVKDVQTLVNKIIDLCRSNYLIKSADSKTYVRYLKIKKSKKLNVDGDFGKMTAELVNLITGNDDTSKKVLTDKLNVWKTKLQKSSKDSYVSLVSTW